LPPGESFHEPNLFITEHGDELSYSTRLTLSYMASACIYPIIPGNNQRWTLIDDHPERRILNSSEAGLPTPRPVEWPKSSQPPRREVRWVDLGANNQSLESIAHHFQDYIDCFLSSSSSTLRRIRALDDPSAFHTCPGYLREEITLMAEVSKSAIVSHAFANLGERCSFCGDLVESDFGQERFRDQEKEGINIKKLAMPPEPPEPSSRAPTLASTLATTRAPTRRAFVYW
jgi:hypothetical protein